VTDNRANRLAWRIVALAAPIALMFGLADAREAHGQACPANRTIGDAAALNAAIGCAASGTTLKLAPGNFGTIEIRNPPATGLTITSVDPLRPAKFNGLAIHGSSGFTLRNLKIGGPPPSGWRYAMLIFRGSGFTADNLELTGDQDEATGALDSAIMIRNIEGARLSHLRIAQHRNGISLLDVRQVEVVNNSITNMRVDGIRGGGVNDARIARNVIGTFHPVAGDHPDGIQLWSRNQKESAENIVIEDNLILRGSGAPIQGIFVEDRINLPFRRLVIRNNLCVGTMYNGIMIMGGEGATISGNSVIPLDPQLSWIRVETSRDVAVTGNEAGKFMLSGGTTTVARNKTGPIRREADAVIRDWRSRLNLPLLEFPI
jgi:hypothetical protein